MPVITMQISKTTVEKKKELIEKLTAAAAEVTNISPSSFVVFIEEYEHDNIGVGGQTLTDKIK
ncbi:4-oxalocrotonate tautomerase family enzyme [Denitrovibrio acetiphilus DSM 12809]|uniref:Tautomerase n=1 Tax=Denitrovibrio acetiphilus (strain DSM 12809 / NBRC 114555 / N2460) TaxID=522772 RepID=D4H240_DENA2|nr:4-oxalocrotonate tautomerase DmpI [Denitrovibrio acetiphilus]ADD67017.1 4-oxalocrotonate tautomerase family enzyme [Denitrovibrio acetiphilus DSM 12809]